jgi:NAD(P)-dependent dehydrogenase (short-subunit alcohol dehydrogenase family)
MYSASKHAILGFMRSLYIPCFQEGIRVAVIHPWFAGSSYMATVIREKMKEI